jgi:hypothetical protein
LVAIRSAAIWSRERLVLAVGLAGVELAIEVENLGLGRPQLELLLVGCQLGLLHVVQERPSGLRLRGVELLRSVSGDLPRTRRRPGLAGRPTAGMDPMERADASRLVTASGHRESLSVWETGSHDGLTV